jgi:peptidoglycan/xylan/chitin deacetylase (PgdA/CDA1 family)
MKRAVLPGALLISLTLTACARPIPHPTVPVAHIVQPSVNPPTTEVDGGGAAPMPILELPPAIKWFPRGIGLPLATEDPLGKEKKVCMLTFDDGPSDSGTTSSILDTLQANDVKAMFFVTGYGAKHRELLKRIHHDGHPMEPHTMTHANMTTLTEEGMRKEIDPLMVTLEEVTGEKPKYFRPPYGAYNKTLLKVLKEDNLELINWDDGSLDWDGTKNGYKDPQLVVKDTMRQLHPGAVILMHDTHKHTAEALPEIIKQIRAKGYEFVVLP